MLAKGAPCAWKQNTVLPITFAAATVGLENDTSATKLPRLNTAMQLFTQSRPSVQRDSKWPKVSPEPNDRSVGTAPVPALHIQR